MPNWKFTIRTPSSSIDRDVRIAPLPDGRLEVLIDTPLFAISGHSQESGCIPLADSRSAPGCYVRFEHRIPLHLTLKVPFDPRSLD